jgi:hypothetical protein
LIPFTFAFGQNTITGKILSEEDSTGLPGVSIVELGSSNEVIADINGNYMIIVSDTARFLEFRYLGFVPRIVPISGQKVINTSLKLAALIDPFDQKIGLFLQSGLVNTPFGARFYYSTPLVGRLSVDFQIDYLTDLELNEKLSASLGVSSYRIIIANWYIYNSVNFNYRKLSISNAIGLNSYSIENYARVNSQKIILGISKFQYSPDSTNSSTKYGLVAGYEKEFQKLNFLTLTYKMGFYKETIEYDLRIDIPIKRVDTFIVLNKVGDYQEIMIGIGFKTYYYYRYQKKLNRY